RSGARSRGRPAAGRPRSAARDGPPARGGAARRRRHERDRIRRRRLDDRRRLLAGRRHRDRAGRRAGKAEYAVLAGSAARLTGRARERITGTRTMLKIWGRRNSINVMKVLWVCEELALTFERIDAGMQFGVVNTPEYAAMNPNRKVPTID